MEAFGTLVFLLVLFAWAGTAVCAVYVAAQKRRPIVEGFILGLLLGPLGLVVEALLPSIWWRCSCGRPRAFGLMKDGEPPPCPKCQAKSIRPS